MLQKEKEKSAQIPKVQLSKPEATKINTFAMEGPGGNKKKSSGVRFLSFFLR